VKQEADERFRSVGRLSVKSNLSKRSQAKTQKFAQQQKVKNGVMLAVKDDAASQKDADAKTAAVGKQYKCGISLENWWAILMREAGGNDEGGRRSDMLEVVLEPGHTVLMEFHISTLNQLLEETVDLLAQVQRRLNLFQRIAGVNAAGTVGGIFAFKVKQQEQFYTYLAANRLMIQSTIDYYWDFVAENVEPTAEEQLQATDGYKAAVRAYSPDYRTNEPGHRASAVSITS
jgi:hypothetical protein